MLSLMLQWYGVINIASHAVDHAATHVENHAANIPRNYKITSCAKLS